jgi:putative transposase
MVQSPGDYPWSSARHHLGNCVDPLLSTSPLNLIVNDWGGLLSSDPDEVREENIRRAERSGRPMGSEAFIDNLERTLNRRLRKMKPGPKNN